MNVTLLINRYFDDERADTNIDVFDSSNIYDVYQRVINVLNRNTEIEISIMQAMSYCFYEILDNVITHSTKNLGTVLSCFNAQKHWLRVLIADEGIGIHKSLSENEKYKNISEKEALLSCIKDSVTDGKGMGFGLYSTSLLIRNTGLRFEIHSGNHKLVYRNNKIEVEESDFWQGTVVFMELNTDKEINPNDIVANRTDCAEQFNETFLNNSELEELW